MPTVPLRMHLDYRRATALRVATRVHTVAHREEDWCGGGA
jgi:hypothetical protein